MKSGGIYLSLVALTVAPPLTLGGCESKTKDQEPAPAQEAGEYAALRVSTLPGNAELILDGYPVENPFHQKMLRHSIHILEARAPGFSETTRRVVMSADDQHLLIRLKSKDERPAKPTQMPPPPPPKRSPLRRADCGKLERCLDNYRRRVASPEDIRAMITEARTECFSAKDPGQLAAEAACLPISMGEDKRNALTLEYSYFCSDLCPAYGKVLLRYEGVPRNDCCSEGGYPRIDSAWGGYRGCAPPETPLIKTLRRRNPGAKLEPATSNPCEPHMLTFDDGEIADTELIDPVEKCLLSKNEVNAAGRMMYVQSACWSRLAEKRADADFCRRIPKGQGRDSCIERLVESVDQPELCDEVESPIMFCRYRQAIAELDPSMCVGVIRHPYVIRCYKEMAEKTSLGIAICDQLETEEPYHIKLCKDVISGAVTR